MQMLDRKKQIIYLKIAIQNIAPIFGVIFFSWSAELLLWILIFEIVLEIIFQLVRGLLLRESIFIYFPPEDTQVSWTRIVFASLLFALFKLMLLSMFADVASLHLTLGNFLGILLENLSFFLAVIITNVLTFSKTLHDKEYVAHYYNLTLEKDILTAFVAGATLVIFYFIALIGGYSSIPALLFILTMNTIADFYLYREISKKQKN